MAETEKLKMLAERSSKIREDTRIFVNYQFLEAHRTGMLKNIPAKYPISIYLGEPINTNRESIFLPFIVSLETKPEFLSFRIKGNIFIKGSTESITEWVLHKDGKPPEIWTHVYRNILRIISEIAGCLKVSLPREILQR